MQQLADIPVFLAVAEAGGFRAAAGRLGMTSAGVSKAVARLETALGARLFERTTRRVDLTAAGAAYLDKARAAMQTLEDGARALDIARESPSGVVRLSLSPVLGPFLATRLPGLAAQVPGLGFDLNLSDAAVDLADKGIDIALRVGDGAAPHLLTRRIARLGWVTVASPAYLARHGRPGTPAALSGHRCFGFRQPSGRVAPWRYLDGTELVPAGPLTVDLGPLLIDAALTGRGIARVFRHMAAPALEAGRLVALFDAQETPGPDVDALIRPSLADSARVRVVLDFLYRSFRDFPV